MASAIEPWDTARASGKSPHLPAVGGTARRGWWTTFRCGSWRRLSLKRVLFICLLLCTVSTLCILCLVVLSATSLNSQLDAEADMATMSARNVGENAVASLSTIIRKDFERTELFVRQTKPIFVDNALSVAADPMAALAAYNKTYCDLFFTRFLAGRGLGEQQGVTIAYNYDNFTRTQAFLLYTDVTRAKRVPLYSYTQANGLNIAYNFESSAPDNTAAAIDFSAPVYSDLEYTITLRATATLNEQWDTPILWAAQDGNMIYYMIYTIRYTPLGEGNYGRVIQTQGTLDAVSWHAWIRQIMTTEQLETSAMFLADQNMRIISTSVSDTITLAADCTGSNGNYSTACYESATSIGGGISLRVTVATELINFLHVRDADALPSEYTPVTESYENPETGKRELVIARTVMRSGRMHLYAVWRGNGASLSVHDNRSTIVFSVLGIVVVIGLITITWCIYGLMQPLHNTIESLERVNALDVGAMMKQIVLDDEAAVAAGQDPAAVALTCDGADVTTQGAHLKAVTSALAVAVMSFARFMPVDVVRELLSTHSLARVDLKHVKLHILFIDIAGFTTISELLTKYPHVLSLLLNRFFTTVCDAVADTDGTVDKFIGDCVMAFWGAPLPHKYSATAALLTALEIARAVRGPFDNFALEQATASVQDLVTSLCGTDEDKDTAHPNANLLNTSGSTDPRRLTLHNPAVHATTHGAGSSASCAAAPPAFTPVKVCEFSDDDSNGGEGVTPNESVEVPGKRHIRHNYAPAGHETIIIAAGVNDDPSGRAKAALSHSDGGALIGGSITTGNKKSVSATVAGTTSHATGTTTNSGNRRGVGLALRLRRTSIGGTSETDEVLEQALVDGVQNRRIRVRIGVHGGMVHVGNMGCAQRLSYTALGDAVNTASRLEGFVKRMEGPCDVVCGAALLDDAHPALLARYIGPVRLAGKREPVRICQVLGAALLNADEVLALRQNVTPTNSTQGGMAHADCDAPEADAAVANYLAAVGLDRAFDAHVLGLMCRFNAAAQAVHAADASAVPALTPHSAAPDAIALVGAAAAGNPAVLRELAALQSAYADIPADLRAHFALEDSLQCVRSGTGAIECDSK